MDVPLALNNIVIRHGSKGYKGKSSPFSHKADVGGLSAFLSLRVSDDWYGMIVGLFETRRGKTSLLCCPTMIDCND